MINTNGYSHRSPMSQIFAFVDGLLIVMGIFMGGIFRFGGMENSIFQVEHLEWKIISIVLVIQTAFYYFDLYELRNFGKRIKMLVLILGAMAVSCLFLGVIYYAIPSLAIGRGLLIISLLNIFILAYLWRFVYCRVAQNGIFKERILIVGTGELAKRIIKEISENGRDSFEIVGFVAERKEEVG